MRFSVGTIAPPDSPHWRTFDEFKAGLKYALGALGHEVADDGRPILFNSHTLGAEAALSPEAILFNAEQVPAGALTEGWQRYLVRLSSHVVWDYSAVNLARLKALGCPRVVHCRVGYYPGLALPAATGREPVDVLFVGSLNERREVMLRRLHDRGLYVKHLFGVYGVMRDQYVQHAKIILNLHYYPSPIWEVFRCQPLLASGKCVVSEDGGVDDELESLMRATCAYASYDQLAHLCQRLVREPERRRALGERAQTVFLQRDQVNYVRAALAETEALGG